MDATAKILTSLPAREMVLRLSTDRHVHAFDLAETFRIAVGRHPSNDVHLPSVRVSNHHAEIINQGEAVIVCDMNSTNGTFVNDESIQRQPLQSGDRIRIGDFTLNVQLLPRNVAGDVLAGGSTAGLNVGTIGNILPLQGDLDPIERAARGRCDLTLADLLNRLAAKKSSVMLVLTNQAEAGRIYFRDGRLVHCECGLARKEKALYRLLALSKGTYEIFALPDGRVIPDSMSAPTEGLVIEGMQQVETLERLSAQLPPLPEQIVLNEDCPVAVNTLGSDEVGVYRDLIRHGTLLRVLEESPLTDFTVLRVAFDLLRKGFFTRVHRPSAVLETTSSAGLR